MTTTQFEAASAWMSSSSSAGSIGNDIKLGLYGLFKFIQTGTGPTGPRPGIFSFEGRAKYDAWSKIAAESMSRSEAEERYVQLARQAGWSEDRSYETTSKPKSASAGFGPTMSMPVAQADDGGASSPVHDAAASGDVTSLRKLLSQDDTLVNSKDEFGYTPLHLAADRGHAEAVTLLLSLKADRSILDPDGTTALELAQVSGRDDVVRALQ